ncbi:hypothetical protein Ccrd_021261 [Cynara cardunculus var. scolymus]|uniref:Homeodomain-like protein n=1 Tax=Cynara cardunculus var. scolymus TaxID=59895 RepID=A0A103Y0X2_CYNCS|nr:hypothetical protein Ccrd_021261 [Cynara cardunculus var. scolymus]
MVRSPCCEKDHTNKGAWTKEEDERLAVESSNSGGGGGVSSSTTSGLSTEEHIPVVNITQPEINLELSIGLPVVSDQKTVAIAALPPSSSFSLYKEKIGDGCGGTARIGDEHGLLYPNEHSVSIGRCDEHN